MKKLVLIFLVLNLCISSIGLAQAPQGGVIGGDDSYLTPQKHTIAAVEVRGVPYYDHDAIRLISGLIPGKEIFHSRSGNYKCNTTIMGARVVFKC